MASGTISAMTTGEHVTIGGLCVQLLFFTVFVITSVVFHMRIRSKHTRRTIGTQRDRCGKTVRNWESVLWGLYFASVLILVRSIFRLVEYAQGNDGYLISHEAFMYVFDAALMFLAMVAMNVFHPCTVLTPSSKNGCHQLEDQIREV